MKTVVINDEVHSALTLYAKENGFTVSGLVHRALNCFLTSGDRRKFFAVNVADGNKKVASGNETEVPSACQTSSVPR